MCVVDSVGHIFRSNSIGPFEFHPTCRRSPKGSAMDGSGGRVNMKFGAGEATAAAVFDDDVCVARCAILQPNSREGRAQCFVAVALRNWTSGRRADDRGGRDEGVTYCLLWGVERSQMDFICLVRRSPGLSSHFSFCAHYNPLLLPQLTLISTRVSCLLLTYAIRRLH